MADLQKNVREAKDAFYEAKASAAKLKADASLAFENATKDKVEAEERADEIIKLPRAKVRLAKAKHMKFQAKGCPDEEAKAQRELDEAEKAYRTLIPASPATPVVTEIVLSEPAEAEALCSHFEAATTPKAGRSPPPSCNTNGQPPTPVISPSSS